nr:MAG TPA: hypothetical protein [Caudoviricetes sp.]
MSINYIPKCLSSVKKPKIKPRRAAIREARVETFNTAISVLKDACRTEKSEAVKRGMYAAITRLEIMRDEV